MPFLRGLSGYLRSCGFHRFTNPRARRSVRGAAFIIMTSLAAGACGSSDEAYSQTVVYTYRFGDKVIAFPKLYIFPFARADQTSRCLQTALQPVLLETGSVDFDRIIDPSSIDYLSILISEPRSDSAEKVLDRIVQGRLDYSDLSQSTETPAGRHDVRITHSGATLDILPSSEARLVECMRTDSVPFPRCETYFSHLGLVVKANFMAKYQDSADSIIRRIKTRLDEWSITETNLPDCPRKPT